MEGESPTQMTGPAGAVFLSYASQDAEVAKHICETLRAGGIEVWFDQSELRGGDVWDRQIRKQIHDCALFVPVISQHTHERLEGYFRREWRLAVERAGDMAENKAFLVPVVIDGAPERDPSVPEKFRELQWTRLPDGQVPPAFIERVQRLLSSVEPHALPTAWPTPGRMSVSARSTVPTQPQWGTKRALPVAAALVVLGAVTYVAIDRPWISKPVVATAFAPPPHSVAVLPFVNMSGDKEQEYFSDGLAEELLNLLSQVQELRVPARTSSFYFKGKQVTVAEIAKALGVAHVLEGSVRKAGNRVRVTVQLIRADNGYHLWSKTYDQDMQDIFKVQDEIAAAVVKGLSASLLSATELPQSVKASSTDAYSLYLQGRAFLINSSDRAGYERAISTLEQATKLDPGFAPAWATLARAQFGRYVDYRIGSSQTVRQDVLQNADRAIALDPGSAEGHLMRGRVLAFEWDWAAAVRETEKALELDGGNADVLRNAAYLSQALGRVDEGVRRSKAAAQLDPLWYYNHMMLGWAEYLAAMPEQAEAEYRAAVALQPDADLLHGFLALALVAQGKHDAALVEIGKESDPQTRALYLPIVLDALGRRAEGDRARAATEAKYGAEFPFNTGVIYAARDDLAHAFEWWDRALRQRDPDLAYSIKTAPVQTGQPQLAADRRYKAVLRKMNLPE
jgi:TolB-like protein/Tfp pilus assembly protein PilF